MRKLILGFMLGVLVFSGAVLASAEDTLLVVGKLSAIDRDKSTVTVISSGGAARTLVIAVGPETLIEKGETFAALADLVNGTPVIVGYVNKRGVLSAEYISAD